MNPSHLRLKFGTRSQKRWDFVVAYRVEGAFSAAIVAVCTTDNGLEWSGTEVIRVQLCTTWSEFSPLEKQEAIRHNS
jgi:hypothetical protein